MMRDGLESDLPSEVKPGEATESLLGTAANDFIERRARGESPSIREYEAKYPEIAAAIRDLFPALDLIANSVGEESVVGSSEHVAFGPNRRIGDFQILEEIGRGGMGIVFSAEHRSMGRKVALKILPFAAVVDSRALTRFKNEVRAAASLDHPNIVPVYAVGEERGIHYYAMQLIHGRSLASLICELREFESSKRAVDSNEASHSNEAADDDETKRPTNVTSAEAEIAASSSFASSRGKAAYARSIAKLGIQAAEALQHAHEQGIVHRDIKPANLLLDTQNRLWVADFGLARIEADAGVTMTGDVLGTLRYMSPEQITSARIVDHRSDVYSLGATLYELLTLKPVVDANDRRRIVEQIAEQDPVPLRRVDPSLPADLQLIIQKSLNKSPDERYGTAKELAQDLSNYLQHRPLIAKPPTTAEKVMKWTRRNPALTWSAVVTMATIVAALLITTWIVRGQRNAALHLAQQLRMNLYASEMGTAYESWNDGVLDRVPKLLRKQINVGDDDLRGTDWYLLGSLFDRYSNEMFSIDDVKAWGLSPREPLLAITTNRQTISLVDLMSRRKTLLVPSAEASGGSQSRLPVFSSDGTRLLIVTSDGVDSYDAATGSHRSFVEGIRVVECKFSADGRRLACVAAATHGNDSLIVVDASTGEVIRRKPDIGHVSALAISPSSSHVAVSINGGSDIGIWHLETDELRIMEAPSPNLKAINYLNQDTVLLGGDRLLLMNVSTGHVVSNASVLTPSARHVTCVDLAADGRLLALGSEHNYAEVWDLQDGTLVWKRTTQNRVIDVKFTNGGRQLLVHFNDTIKLYDVAATNANKLLTTTRFHWVDALDVHGESVLVAGPDGGIVLWNLADGPHGLTLSARKDRDASTKLANEVRVQTVSFSRNGKMFASSGSDGIVRIWDTKTKTEIDGYGFRMESPVRHLEFSPDGESIAIARSDGVETRALSGKALWSHAESITVVVQYSVDGRWLFSGGGRWPPSRDGNLTVWDMRDKTPVAFRRFDHDEIVLTCAVSPDNRWLAVGDYGRQVAIYDLRTWEVAARLSGHSLAIQGLAFSPDSHTLLTGAYDGTIKLWRVGTWQSLGELVEPDAIQSLKFIAAKSQLGLVIGTRYDEESDAGVKVHWIDSDDSAWRWLGLGDR